MKRFAAVALMLTTTPLPGVHAETPTAQKRPKVRCVPTCLCSVGEPKSAQRACGCLVQLPETVKVRAGRTTVLGGLGKGVVQRTLRRHHGEVRYCYEAEQYKSPELTGKVTVAFTIDPTGGVSEANLSESTLDSSSVEQCILRRVRRWRFPDPADGSAVTVTTTWQLSPVRR